MVGSCPAQSRTAESLDGLFTLPAEVNQRLWSSRKTATIGLVAKANNLNANRRAAEMIQ